MNNQMKKINGSLFKIDIKLILIISAGCIIMQEKVIFASVFENIPGTVIKERFIDLVIRYHF